MAVRKRSTDKSPLPLAGLPHKIKQVWREMQSQIGDRLSDFDAWAVERVNDSLEGIGEKFTETVETAKETLHEKYENLAENLTKRPKKRPRRR